MLTIYTLCGTLRYVLPRHPHTLPLSPECTEYTVQYHARYSEIFVPSSFTPRGIQTSLNRSCARMLGKIQACVGCTLHLNTCTAPCATNADGVYFQPYASYSRWATQEKKVVPDTSTFSYSATVFGACLKKPTTYTILSGTVTLPLRRHRHPTHHHQHRTAACTT